MTYNYVFFKNNQIIIRIHGLFAFFKPVRKLQVNTNYTN